MRALVLLFASLDVAYGCKCAPLNPPCGDVWRSPLVFLGTVTDPGVSWETFLAEMKSKLKPAQAAKLESGVDLSDTEIRAIVRPLLPPEGQRKLKRAKTDADFERLWKEYIPFFGQPMRRVRFRVLETYQGENVNDREVWTGKGYGDCGVDFVAGRTYLVYTYEDADTGRMETGSCTRTRESTGKDEEIEYLRGFRRGEGGNQVVGFVLGDFRELPSFVWGSQPKSGIAEAQVLLRGPELTRKATTDHSGWFSFPNLASGSYEISVADAEGQSFWKVPRMLEVPVRGCAQAVIVHKMAP
jgi:hypothetical protein